jgi:hypothetical protein
MAKLLDAYTEVLGLCRRPVHTAHDAETLILDFAAEDYAHAHLNDFAGQVGMKAARFGSKCDATSPSDGALGVADTSPTSSLLAIELPAGALDFPSGLSVCRALAKRITVVNDTSVENIPAYWMVEDGGIKSDNVVEGFRVRIFCDKRGTECNIEG